MITFKSEFVDILNTISEGHETLIKKWSSFNFGGIYEKPNSYSYIPEKNYVENLRKSIICEAVDTYFKSIDNWHEYNFKDFCRNVYESDLI